MIDEKEKTIVRCIEEVTKENICSDEVLIWLFDTNDEVLKQRNFNKLEEMAVGWRKKKDFTAIYRAFNKEWEKEKRRDAQENGNSPNFSVNKTNFKSKYKELNCGNWVADLNGISAMIGRVYSVIIYQPVTIVSQLINVETGEEKTKLAFKKMVAGKKLCQTKTLLRRVIKSFRCQMQGFQLRRRMPVIW